MESDLGKRTNEELEEEYCRDYWKFYDNIILNELNWARAVRTAYKLDEMSQFFAEEPKVWKLKLWGFNKGDDRELYREAWALNHEKLKKAKEGGKFYGEEDDLDIEGERLLWDITNFKAQLVKSSFYDGEF